MTTIVYKINRIVPAGLKDNPTIGNCKNVANQGESSTQFNIYTTFDFGHSQSYENTYPTTLLLQLFGHQQVALQAGADGAGGTGDQRPVGGYTCMQAHNYVRACPRVTLHGS